MFTKELIVMDVDKEELLESGINVLFALTSTSARIANLTLSMNIHS